MTRKRVSPFHAPYGGRKMVFLNSWAKLKDGMTAETCNALRAADRTPREGTRDGRAYDERRAKAYMAWLTGETIDSCKWDESKRAVQFVKSALGTEYEIPNWDAALVEADLNALVAAVALDIAA